MKLFVFFLGSLGFDILLNCIFVPMSAHHVHIVSLCPKFPTSKFLFFFRVEPQYLLRCDTLYIPDYLGRAQHGNTLYQKMDMILVRSNLYKINLVPFRYLKAYFLQTFINCFPKKQLDDTLQDIRNDTLKPIQYDSYVYYSLTP